jgi:16S rRNA (cytosine967-C5)-methyltransferase
MNNSEQKIPLWRQLQSVAAVLMSIRAGASATAALAGVAADLRPGVQSLLFHALRFLGRADVLRQQLVSRTPPPAADALLCVALALAWNEQEAPYEVFTLVNQAVEAAKRTPATQAQASFINACLRRFLREREALVAASSRYPLALWNHPPWWIERLKKDHPQRWQDILKANNRPGPMSLRVNARQSDVPAYLQRLQDAGIQARAAGRYGVTLAQAQPVHALPGFDQGMVSVQDVAAQMAAPLLCEGLDRTQPLRILDACAAPGGKTAHLLEISNAQVTALDIDPARCERISQTLTRLGLQARVLAQDAGHPERWWDGEMFDAILLDAPCTASGIVRRHPDVRWLRRPSDIAQLAAIQAGLLKTLWPLLKPGGRLLYCTCSVFREEGEDQIQTFLVHNTEAVLKPSPGHLMPYSGVNGGAVLDNPHDDHDGFYYALLEKRKA